MGAFHLGTNARRFGHGVIPPLAFLMVSILPLLFGGLFVWSYADPLGNLHKVPVAIVNSDAGDKGQTVADKLVESNEMDFHVVSPEDAEKGIADGTYYLGMEIPTDFTDSVTSIKSDNPHQATLAVTLNNANGFITSMLGNQATTLMADTISTTVSHEVVDQLLVGFNTVGEGMDKAVDGAGQLADGAGQLHAGADKAKNGAGTLNEKLGEAAHGAAQLAGGADELNAGAGKLHDGATQLDNGLGTALDGATQLSGGLTKLQGATAQLGDGAGKISGGVDTLTGFAAGVDGIVAQLNQAADQLDALPYPEAHGLAAQVRATRDSITTNGSLGQIAALRDGAHQLAYQLGDPTADYRLGIDQATQGARSLVDGLTRLKDGSGTLLAGTTTLTDGTQRLVVGTHQLADGTSQLAAGSDQLVVGLGDLSDGAVRLDDGAGKLALSLSEGAEKLPRFDDDATRDDAATAGSHPVGKNLVADTLTTFGVGLSPFFLSLSLWLGSLILYMVLKPINRRAIDSGTSPLRAAMTIMVPGLIVGTIQALLLALVQTKLIGIEPAHPLQYVGALVFIGATFNMVVLSIYSFFGATVGRVIVMALMSLQLVSSNGLYPPEVQPGFIQWVHTWDPMRYSTDLLRHVLVGNFPGDPRPETAMWVLLGLLIGGILITVFSNYRERVMMRKDLHPELTL